MKTIVVAVLIVLALAALAPAQLSPAGSIIERLTGEKRGGWVKHDKEPATPSYERVYCITIDGSASCDWSDVRTIHVARLSRS